MTPPTDHNSEQIQASPDAEGQSAAHVHPGISLVGAFLYCLAQLGFGAFYSLNNAVLPLWLSRYTKNAILINLMSGVHSFEGALLQPIAGSVSDHARWKLGRRRPFLMVFVPISALFLALVPAAAHTPFPASRLALIVVFIVISTAAFNLAQDPYQALLADIAAPDQRGRLTGLWMFFGAAGQVLLLVLPIDAVWKFGACAALMAATTAITCLSTREAPASAVFKKRPSAATLIRDGLSALATLKQARLYLIVFLLYGAGSVAVVPNLVLFIKYVTHCSDKRAQLLFMFLMLVTACATVLFGLISDRVGAIRLLSAGYMLVIAASVAGCFVRSMAQVTVALFIAGLGIAAQNASSFPLLIRLVPDKEVGLFAGLQTTALSIVEPLSAILTGHLINSFGYRSIFASCGLWIAVATIVLSQVRQDKAPAEIALREAG